MTSVSIIIPIYNVEDYIEQCLDSVLNQTFTDIEIICILDGPTDRSSLLTEEYAKRDPRILVIQQPNMGVSVARNAGLRVATGEYIAFVDGDDWVAPDFIERLYHSAITTNAGMVICNYQFDQKTSIIQNNPLPDGIHDCQEICRALILDQVFKNYMWNKLIKKAIFDQHQIVFPVGILFEDMAIMSQIAYCSGKVMVINEYLYYYRSRTDSSMNTYNAKRFWDIFKSLEIVKAFLTHQNIYSRYQGEYEYNCVCHLLGNAKLICKQAKQQIHLISKMKDSFYSILDERKSISGKTRKLLSLHQRIALKVLLCNSNIYAMLSSRKWI